MIVHNSDPTGADVRLSSEELLILNNAMNEICNGVWLQDWDFSTRMGVDRPRATDLLRSINQLLRG